MGIHQEKNQLIHLNMDKSTGYVSFCLVCVLLVINDTMLGIHMLHITPPWKKAGLNGSRSGGHSFGCPNFLSEDLKTYCTCVSCFLLLMIMMYPLKV